MLLENLRLIRERIEVAARKAGRNPAAVDIVAVTKKASPEAVRELLRSGQVRFVGENRVQDAVLRRKTLGEDAGLASWRFIGRLQSNKARQALELFDWIDSLDSLRLAAVLDAQLTGSHRRLKALIQVKLTERETQGGVDPEQLGAFLEGLRPFRNLEACGLMAIAPMLEPVEAVRPYFRRMKALLERHFPAQGREELPRLSIGMSRDFEIAVEEGADLVRIGTALFS
ncbi:MAG: YggS family pyridoxal phosphate-dependent enzyme [Elusimicrobia bacterium]|nr:YggS family pyridoxal phosphate-dependent enzyme [Elusimicrobiota bacterium]